MATGGADHQVVKIVLVGDGASGKTSIISRYCQDGFGPEYTQTVGLDFFMKRIEMPGDATATLQIWDIGGQSIGGKMVKTYLHGADAVLLVYDQTNRESFENLQDWLQVVTSSLPEKKPPILICGNKEDLHHLATVEPRMVERFLELANLPQYYKFRVSAKTGENIDLMFREIVGHATGIKISTQELQRLKSRHIKATILQHPKGDPGTVIGDTKATARFAEPQAGQVQKSNFCSIQ
eukprot:m.45214 g.45214  ORF g.45214 m.45214 type:complete len:237 (+) comp10872_c0_seq1:328-1038(+)